MKICSSCKREKSIDDFHKRASAKDGKQSICKECNSDQRKKYYRTAHGKATNQATGKRWEHQLKSKIADYLRDHPCIVCGESDIRVLDFDHRDAQQKFMSISQMSRKGFGWNRILDEIAKCDVLCANDHRRRTAEQFGWIYKQ